jgi:spoIIIJ-associated protein
MEVDVTKKDRRLYANFTGDGMGILIGKRGQTIDSLQYLANLMINGRGIKDYNVILDTGNYRKRRRDTLEALARNIARKVRDTRQNVKLEPMSRFERHIIHTALQNNKDVRTFSEGNEPHRYVVVGIK